MPTAAAMVSTTATATATTAATGTATDLVEVGVSPDVTHRGLQRIWLARAALFITRGRTVASIVVRPAETLGDALGTLDKALVESLLQRIGNRADVVEVVVVVTLGWPVVHRRTRLLAILILVLVAATLVAALGAMAALPWPLRTTAITVTVAAIALLSMPALLALEVALALLTLRALTWPLGLAVSAAVFLEILWAVETCQRLDRANV